MKKKNLLIPFLAFTLAVTSCGTKIDAPDSEEIDTTYYFIFGDNMDTKAHIKYSNDYFRVPATTFNKDFALTSFVATANSGQKKEMKKFYDAIHFTNHYYTEVYDKGSGPDTYGFYIASREIDNFTLIALSFRSYDYTQEWVSNVTLGKEGNHEGFESAVNQAMERFNSYISKEYKGKILKLWVNGFSRGGAEANLFTTKLLNDNQFGFTKENVYCYTFEAPACLSAENVKPEYTNIFNLSNSGDIVVNVPPSDYGLYRSGIDIDILRDDFDQLFADYMYEIYPEPIKDSQTGEMVDKAKQWIDGIPAFKKSKKYQNESEFIDEFVSRILKEDDPDYGIQDREHYVLHFQTAARFLTKLFFSLDDLHKYWVINNFQKNYLDTASHMLNLASLVVMKDGEGLYEILSYYLRRIHYEFEEAEVRETCKTLYNILTKLGFNDMMSIYNVLPNVMRALYFHWHESSYVLLRALEYTPANAEVAE